MENELGSHHTNVCKMSRLCVAIFSLVFNKSLSNLSTLLILRLLSSRVDEYSLTGPSEKLKRSWKALFEAVRLIGSVPCRIVPWDCFGDVKTPCTTKLFCAQA